MRASRNNAGFSLVELMTATAVATMLMLILAGVSSQVSRLLSLSLGQSQNRSNARVAISIMSRELRQAAISPGKTLPQGAATMTQSALQLLINPPDTMVSSLFKNRDAIFWQAPIATTTTSGDIAEVGYFVYQQRVNNVYRSDLCRFFANPSDNQAPRDWHRIYTQPLGWLDISLLSQFVPTKNNDYNGLFVENVVGLWAKPYGRDGKPLPVPSTHEFDSRNNSNSSGMDSLPAMIQIGMVVLSAEAIKRLPDNIPVNTHDTADACYTYIQGQAQGSDRWKPIFGGTDVLYFNVTLDNSTP